MIRRILVIVVMFIPIISLCARAGAEEKSVIPQEVINVAEYVEKISGGRNEAGFKPKDKRYVVYFPIIYIEVPSSLKGDDREKYWSPIMTNLVSYQKAGYLYFHSVQFIDPAHSQVDEIEDKLDLLLDKTVNKDF